MPYRDLEPMSKQLTIVVGLTVVGFMTFGLALSFYRNVLFEETLQTIGVQNELQRAKNDESQHDLDYFRSNQYKDKYAKENLDRVDPGEHVLIVHEGPKPVSIGLTDSLTPTEQEQAAYEEHLREMPVYQHWELYLFRRDELETLKHSLAE